MSMTEERRGQLSDAVLAAKNARSLSWEDCDSLLEMLAEPDWQAKWEGLVETVASRTDQAAKPKKEKA